MCFRPHQETSEAFLGEPLPRSPRKASLVSCRGRSRFVDRTADRRRPLDAQFPYSHARGSRVQSKECSLLRTRLARPLQLDRKSTRLNSSHGYISYAVFCLKKKNLPICDE